MSCLAQTNLVKIRYRFGRFLHQGAAGLHCVQGGGNQAQDRGSSGRADQSGGSAGRQPGAWLSSEAKQEPRCLGEAGRPSRHSAAGAVIGRVPVHPVSLTTATSDFSRLHRSTVQCQLGEGALPHSAWEGDTEPWEGASTLEPGLWTAVFIDIRLITPLSHGPMFLNILGARGAGLPGSILLGR